MSTPIQSSASASATSTTPSLSEILRASAERRKRRFAETKPATSTDNATSAATCAAASQALAATQTTASTTSKENEELGRLVLHAKRKRQKLTDTKDTSLQSNSSSNSSSHSSQSSLSATAGAIASTASPAPIPTLSDEEWAKIWDTTPTTAASWDDGSSSSQMASDAEEVRSSEPIDTYVATKPTVRVTSGTVIGTVIFPENLGEGLINCAKNAVVNTVVLGSQGLIIEEYTTDALSVTVRAGTTINSIIFSSAGGTVTCEQGATVKEITNGDFAAI